MTIDEVVATGTTKMRLPNWAEGSYGEVYIDPASGKLGPWFTVVTPGLPEAKVLISAADTYSTYEPVV